MAIKPMTYAQEEIVASKINLLDEDGCWTWIGYQQTSGYGQVKFDGRSQVVHRRLYEAWEGEIVQETLDHTCRNKLCVNPAHLEQVSRVDNVKRSFPHRVQKTHCPAGHPYAGENLYMYKGNRKCKECKKAATARWKARNG